MLPVLPPLHVTASEAARADAAVANAASTADAYATLLQWSWHNHYIILCAAYETEGLFLHSRGFSFCIILTCSSHTEL